MTNSDTHVYLVEKGEDGAGIWVWDDPDNKLTPFEDRSKLPWFPGSIHYGRRGDVINSLIHLDSYGDTVDRFPYFDRKGGCTYSMEDVPTVSVDRLFFGLLKMLEVKGRPLPDPKKHEILVSFDLTFSLQILDVCKPIMILDPVVHRRSLHILCDDIRIPINDFLDVWKNKGFDKRPVPEVGWKPYE